MTYTPDFTEHVTKNLTPIYVQNSYFSSGNPGSVEATITGPAYIQTGVICRDTQSGYAYAQQKFNSGEFENVPLGAKAGSGNDRTGCMIHHTMIGPFFLGPGETYTVKVGQIFSGSSVYHLGGSFWIKYYQL